LYSSGSFRRNNGVDSGSNEYLFNVLCVQPGVKVAATKKPAGFENSADSGTYEPTAVSVDPYASYRESVCFPGGVMDGVSADGQPEIGKTSTSVFDDENYEPVEVQPDNCEPAQIQPAFDNPEYGEVTF